MAGLWGVYLESGRTPAEWVNKIELIVQEEPLTRDTFGPAFESIREWFHEPPYGGGKTPFVVPPLHSNTIGRNPGVGFTDARDSPRVTSEKSMRGRILRVGSGRALRTVGMATRIAKDGDVIEMDAGDYYADVAVLERGALTVRGVGGRARIHAVGAHAEGKAIWVVRGGSITVENIEFIGAAVPDRDGAGIRLEGGHLIVRNCLFYGNQSGVLTAGGESELEVESSEFAYNGNGDGFTHQLYVGAIRSLKVTGSYFHHANVGHHIKSRAARNFITFNRFADGRGGRASYEMEFPNGGIAHVIGNIIQQGPQTQNPIMVSFGAEGYRHPQNELHLVANTLVDERAGGGIFVRVAPGATALTVADNIFAGKAALGPLGALAAVRIERNVSVDVAEFRRAVDADFQWKQRPAWLAAAGDAGTAQGVPLRPASEYRHPRSTLPRRAGSAAAVVGALQPTQTR